VCGLERHVRSSPTIKAGWVFILFSRCTKFHSPSIPKVLRLSYDPVCATAPHKLLETPCPEREFRHDQITRRRSIIVQLRARCVLVLVLVLVPSE
jgi:hypothetical protein